MKEEVLKFWFEEIEQSKWWVKDEAFDELIRTRFLSAHQQAVCGELSDWRDTAEGRLAEIIVLDQFSRNMFRDKPEAFAYDSLALVLAQEAVRSGADQELDDVKRGFIYMPYMHSESLKVHETAVELFKKSGSEGGLDFELKHKRIIEKFGRYPHRNHILGRESTQEEIEFLKQPDSSF